MLCLTTEPGVDRAGHRRALLPLLPPGDHRVGVWSRRRGWGRGGGPEGEKDGGGRGGGGGEEAPAPPPQGPFASPAVEMLAAAAFFLPGREVPVVLCLG